MRLARVVAFFASVVVLAGCGGSSAPQPVGVSGDPIQVGVILPLSGANASIGQQQLAGMRAAVEYLQAHGGAMGHPINLAVRDSTGAPTQAAASLRDLLQSGVVVVLGDVTSATFLAEAPVFNQAQIPSFSSATADTIWASGANPYAFGVGQGAAAMSAELNVRYLVKNLNLTKIGIIYENGTFGKSSSDASVSALKTYGLTPSATEVFQTGSTDVGSQLQALKSAGAQGLLVWTFGTGLVTVARSLQAMAWSPPSATVTGLSADAVVKATGADALKNFFGGPTASRLLVGKVGDNPKNPLTNEFLRLLRAQLNVSTFNGEQIGAIVGFDELMVPIGAINKAQSTKGPDIKKALESGAGFDGAEATFHFSSTTHYGIAIEQVGLYQGGLPCPSGCQAAPGIPT